MNETTMRAPYNRPAGGLAESIDDLPEEVEDRKTVALALGTIASMATTSVAFAAEIIDTTAQWDIMPNTVSAAVMTAGTALTAVFWNKIVRLHKSSENQLD